MGDEGKGRGGGEEGAQAQVRLAKEVESVLREMACLPGTGQDQGQGQGQGTSGPMSEGAGAGLRVHAVQWHSRFHVHCRRMPTFLAGLPSSPQQARQADPSQDNSSTALPRADPTAAPAASPAAPASARPTPPPGGGGRKRVVFLGDAAHVHSPVGGQGLNAGMQDAHNAAWKLALAVRGVAGESVMESFDKERCAAMDQVRGGAGRGMSERGGSSNGIPAVVKRVCADVYCAFFYIALV